MALTCACEELSARRCRTGDWVAVQDSRAAFDRPRSIGAGRESITNRLRSDTRADFGRSVLRGAWISFLPHPTKPLVAPSEPWSASGLITVPGLGCPVATHACCSVTG